MAWWRRFANHPENFRARAHEDSGLAHYAKGCYDVEYLYPWGWDELEGIANRTDYDLKTYGAQRLEDQYFDPVERKRYTPYVIEPAAGATEGVLTYLCDAYHEEEVEGPKGTDTRVVLKLHPQLAPVKVCIMPLVKKNGMPEKARRTRQLLVQTRHQCFV